MKTTSYITGILCAAFTAISMNGATSEPMLFYCDDVVEAYPREEVDSITFSRYDMDSVLCNHLATQIVWTKGLRTRYPIETIDSVLFASTVKNQLLPRVREIKGTLWDHVISCEDNHILHINPSIPEDLIPRTGEKLVTTEMSDKFPVGFIGEVQTIDRTANDIVVDCEQIGLTDVYSSFSGFFESDITNNGQIEDNGGTENQPSQLNPSPKPQALTGSLNLTLPTFRKTVSLGASTLGGLLDLNIGLDNSFTFELSPTLRVRTFAMIESFGKLYTSSRIIADIHCRETLSSNMSVNYSHDWDMTRGQLIKPVAPGIMLYLEGGMTFSANGQWALESESNQHFRLSAHTTMTTGGAKNTIKPTLDMRLVDNNSSHPGAVGSANVSMGGYLELGLAAIHKNLLNVHARAEFGVKTTLDASVEDWEIECSQGIAANMYNALTKEDSFQFGSYNAATLGAEGPGGIVSANLELHNSFKPIFQTSILPRFRNIKAKRREIYPRIVDVSADIVPGLLNCKYGWKMIEFPDENHYILLDELLDERTYLYPDNISTSFYEVPYDSERFIIPTLHLPNNMTIATYPYGEPGTTETDYLEAQFEDEYITVDAEFIDDVITSSKPNTDRCKPWVELSLPFDAFDYESFLNNQEDVDELGLYIKFQSPKDNFDIDAFINGKNWDSNYERYPWHLFSGEYVLIPIYKDGKWLINPSTKRYSFRMPDNYIGIQNLSETSALLYAHGFTGLYARGEKLYPNVSDRTSIVNIHPWIWTDTDTRTKHSYTITSSSIKILNREERTGEVTFSLKRQNCKYPIRMQGMFPPGSIYKFWLGRDLTYQHLFDRYPTKDTEEQLAFKCLNHYDNISFEPFLDEKEESYHLDKCSNHLIITTTFRYDPYTGKNILNSASSRISD